MATNEATIKVKVDDSDVKKLNESLDGVSGSTEGAGNAASGMGSKLRLAGAAAAGVGVAVAAMGATLSAVAETIETFGEKGLEALENIAMGSEQAMSSFEALENATRNVRGEAMLAMQGFNSAEEAARELAMRNEELASLTENRLGRAFLRVTGFVQNFREEAGNAIISYVANLSNASSETESFAQQLRLAFAAETGGETLAQFAERLGAVNEEAETLRQIEDIQRRVAAELANQALQREELQQVIADQYENEEQALEAFTQNFLTQITTLDGAQREFFLRFGEEGEALYNFIIEKEQELQDARMESLGQLADSNEYLREQLRLIQRITGIDLGIEEAAEPAARRTAGGGRRRTGPEDKDPAAIRLAQQMAEKQREFAEAERQRLQQLDEEEKLRQARRIEGANKLAEAQQAQREAEREAQLRFIEEQRMAAEEERRILQERMETQRKYTEAFTTLYGNTADLILSLEGGTQKKRLRSFKKALGQQLVAEGRALAARGIGRAAAGDFLAGGAMAAAATGMIALGRKFGAGGGGGKQRGAAPREGTAQQTVIFNQQTSFGFVGDRRAATREIEEINRRTLERGLS